jgi:hypothetical protein
MEEQLQASRKFRPQAQGVFRGRNCLPLSPRLGKHQLPLKA